MFELIKGLIVDLDGTLHDEVVNICIYVTDQVFANDIKYYSTRVIMSFC